MLFALVGEDKEMSMRANKKLTAIWLSAALLLALSGVAQIGIAGQYQYTAVCTDGHGSLSGWTSRDQAQALGNKHGVQNAGHHWEVRWR